MGGPFGEHFEAWFDSAWRYFSCREAIMDARDVLTHEVDVLTHEVVETITAYGCEFPVENPQQVKEGYLQWIGFASSYEEEERLDLPIGPGHLAWQVLDVVFDRYVDWVRVHKEITEWMASDYVV